LFVADRLLETDEEDDQALGRKLRDEVALKTVPAQHITQGLFALSGNTPEAILDADLRTADGTHNHISIGFHVEDHEAFITEIYEEAADLGDDR
jgi:hypothetical protein